MCNDSLEQVNRLLCEIKKKLHGWFCECIEKKVNWIILYVTGVDNIGDIPELNNGTITENNNYNYSNTSLD